MRRTDRSIRQQCLVHAENALVDSSIELGSFQECQTRRPALARLLPGDRNGHSHELLFSTMQNLDSVRPRYWCLLETAHT